MKSRLLVVIGLVLALSVLTVGNAFADDPDPFDPSFESGDLSGWNIDSAPDSVGVSSGDSYATPLYGNSMAVLGTPGTYIGQLPGLNSISQVFKAVDKVIQFAFNIFTFDYTGWDLFGGKLSVVDTGEVIAEEWQTAWGPIGDTSLKTTGWQEITIDVSAYSGQELKLEVGCGGTWDYLYGTWCYFDGPPPPVALEAPSRQLKLYYPADQELQIRYHRESKVIKKIHIIPGDDYALTHLRPGIYDFTLAPNDASSAPVFQGTVVLLLGLDEVTLWFPLHNAEPGVFSWGFVVDAL